MDIKDFDQYLAEIYEDRDDSHFRIGSMLSALEYEVRMLKQLIYSHLDRHNAEIEKSKSAWDELPQRECLNADPKWLCSPTNEWVMWAKRYESDLKRIPKR